MSDYRAIADVTRTLRTLLLDRVEYAGTFNVTNVPPDVTPALRNQAPWLNLYLYQLAENASLKNQEIPGRGHPADYGHPPLALDLYYLLTARIGDETGEDSEFEVQQLLGAAMRVFHDLAWVSENLSITRDSAGVIGDPVLAAGLRGEFEQLKITLQPVTMDDLSKLWTALPQGSFRRSVAYCASVIQIESRRSRRYPRPVGEGPVAGPKVYAIPSTRPRIGELRVRRNDEESRYPYAGVGQTLLVLGNSFYSDSTLVHIDSVEVASNLLQEQRIELTIPDNPSLQPGPLTVRVSRQIEMGDPPQPHVGFHSNLAIFVLVPSVDSATLSGRQLTLAGSRLYRADGDCLVLVGDWVVPDAAYSERTPTTLSFELSTDLPAGRYSVRVRVDGVEGVELPQVEVPEP